MKKGKAGREGGREGWREGRWQKGGISRGGHFAGFDNRGTSVSVPRYRERPNGCCAGLFDRGCHQHQSASLPFLPCDGFHLVSGVKRRSNGKKKPIGSHGPMPKKCITVVVIISQGKQVWTLAETLPSPQTKPIV